MNIEKVYIEQEPITYGLLFWGISNDMFKNTTKISRIFVFVAPLSFLQKAVLETNVGRGQGMRDRQDDSPRPGRGVGY